jgi:hypothetical protein
VVTRRQVSVLWDASGVIALAADGPASAWRSHVVLADADAHSRLLNTDTFDPNLDGSRLLLLKMPDPRDPLELISLSGCRDSRLPTVIP